MAEGRDEIEAAVDSVVLDVPSVQAALVSEVLLKLLVNVVYYLFPAGENMQCQYKFSELKNNNNPTSLNCF